MNGINMDSYRHAPGVPQNVNTRDTQTFLVVAGFRPPAAAEPKENLDATITPSISRNTVIDTLMEAELLLQELEEQPRDQDDPSA